MHMTSRAPGLLGSTLRTHSPQGFFLQYSWWEREEMETCMLQIYFFLMHFVTCYRKPIFSQSNEWFKGKLTFVIFSQPFFQPVLFLLFGNCLERWLGGDHVCKDLTMSYKAEIMLTGKIQVFRCRVLSPKESGSDNTAWHCRACTVGHCSRVFSCFSLSGILCNECSQEHLEYLSLVRQKRKEKKSFEN